MPLMPRTAIDLRQLAHDWYAAWNTHDLDAVLAHYADDVGFVSPFAAALNASPDGVVTGKPALRAYWQWALVLFPVLLYDPIIELYAVRGFSLHNRSVQ